MNSYRIIDANINRASEGLRVLEDIARFILDDKEQCTALKELRHRVRKDFVHPGLLHWRNAEDDPGLAVSAATQWDRKEHLRDLVSANFKRVQEALRAIEECLKILGHNHQSKLYEQHRFNVYKLEQCYNISQLSLHTDIYGVTGEEFSHGKDATQLAQEMIDAGITVIQYREKNKPKAEKYHQCQLIRRLTADAGVTFIVNDDVDIALAVNADGVHLGQEDLPAAQARSLLGKMLLGVSTHNPAQAKAALADGADYIGVGPIFPTRTKQKLEPSAGLDYLEWVTQNIPLPHVAIGGISEDNIEQVARCGGKCCAMITELTAAASIKEKVAAIRQRLAEK